MLVPKKRFPIKEIALVGFLPSKLKIAFYRFRGYQIGRGVHLGLGSVLVGKNVIVEEGASVGFLAVIKADTIKIGRYVKIGATVLIDTVRFEIGDDSRINEQVFVGGIKRPESALILGQRTIIMQMTFVNPTLPITIGDDTGIGGHCLLFTHGSWSSVLDGYPVTFAPITIEKNVWLPWRVFVMPGVSIGRGAVVGADSTIVKNVPPNALAVGSPAKVVKESVTVKLSTEQKKTLVKGILEDFIDQMVYSGAKVRVVEEDENKRIVIKWKDNDHDVYLFNENESPNKTISSSNFVALGWLNDYSANFPMYLNLEQKTRIGSTDVGEELVSFLSRYGIRFKRLD